VVRVTDGGDSEHWKMGCVSGWRGLPSKQLKIISRCRHGDLDQNKTARAPNEAILTLFTQQWIALRDVLWRLRPKQRQSRNFWLAL